MYNVIYKNSAVIVGHIIWLVVITLERYNVQLYNIQTKYTVRDFWFGFVTLDDTINTIP